MNKAFQNIKNRIESKKFGSFSEARIEISKNLVKGNITNEEHTELRLILNKIYTE